ncbi:hypothetical protein C8J57DRAFT_1516019 [Mycena rebaudengoi]|nr:hypothetical protein C8J57DRAFT_1516019 [Mycena rebaudengoi]
MLCAPFPPSQPCPDPVLASNFPRIQLNTPPFLVPVATISKLESAPVQLPADTEEEDSVSFQQLFLQSRHLNMLHWAGCVIAAQWHLLQELALFCRSEWTMDIVHATLTSTSSIQHLTLDLHPDVPHKADQLDNIHLSDLHILTLVGCTAEFISSQLCCSSLNSLSIDIQLLPLLLLFDLCAQAPIREIHIDSDVNIVWLLSSVCFDNLQVLSLTGSDVNVRGLQHLIPAISALELIIPSSSDAQAWIIQDTFGGSCFKLLLSEADHDGKLQSSQEGMIGSQDSTDESQDVDV